MYKNYLKVDQIEKKFGDQVVLKKIDLQIQEGEFLSLVGPSGCGKSTLLRIIAGLEPQYQGHIWLRDQRIDDLLPSERNMSMVFQSYALYPHLTVAENIRLPLEVAGLNLLSRLPLTRALFPGDVKALSEISARVQETASLLKIDNLLERKPDQLSGGQKQRVALARAIIRKPTVFLMDEPLSNLDAKLRVEVRDELIQLHRRLGITFIYVTHDQSEAMTMSDRIAVMEAGELLQIGTPKQLYKNPSNLRVAKFIGTPQINTVQMGVDEAFQYFFDQTKALLSDPTELHTLSIRPEHLKLSATLESSHALGMRATIERIEDLGNEVLAHVNVGQQARSTPLTARVTDSMGDFSLEPGASIFVSTAIHHWLAFDKHGVRLPIHMNYPVTA